MSTPDPSAAGEQVKEGYEERAADDRPQDRKRIATHAEHERLAEVELPRDPRAEQCANEADSGGHQQPATRTTSQCSTDGAADRRDEDQQYQPWQCQRHSNLLATGRFAN